MNAVVPRVGTWIEISVREHVLCQVVVVPRVGTWIEILLTSRRTFHSLVVPRVGTWIEMGNGGCDGEMARSSPAWGRGLKS